ncbi:MAG: BLUF domain-containing protein [Gluconacetobacter diazotrophicus]|nr:BLUF domain-containing protein [Gluconacetobacter diazotrophicus]
MPDLFQVLYCSRNRFPGGVERMPEWIDAILLVSRRNNARDRITGGLLFSGERFAQVLEGPMEKVTAAFERIQCDERHGDVVVLRSGPIAERNFASWAMGFANSDAAMLPAHAATADGDAVLSVLRAVVVRETEWLRPTVGMGGAAEPAARDPVPSFG